MSSVTNSQSVTTPLLSSQPQPTSAPRPPDPDPNDGVPPVRWVRNTFEGHATDMTQNVARPFVNNVLSTRSWDIYRQFSGAMIFGFCCLPFAITRIVKDCRGGDPMHLNVGDSRYTIIGGECLSAPDCSQVCGNDDRGYGHEDYRRGQDEGPGMSRSTIDKVTVACSPVLPAVLIGVSIAQA